MSRDPSSADQRPSGPAAAIVWALADRRATIAGLWLLGLVGVGLSLVLPSQVGRLTGMFAGGQQVTWAPVLWAVACLVGAQLGLSAITYVRARLEVVLREAAIRRLTLRVYARVLRFGAEFFRGQEVERINARAMEDTSRVVMFWATAVVAVPLAAASIAVLGAVMLLDNWLLALCMIVFSVLSGYFVVFDRLIQSINHDMRDNWETIRASANEVVGGVAEVRGHAAFDHALGGLDKSFHGHQRVMERFGRFIALFRAMDPLVGTVQKGALLALGAALCIAGSQGTHSAAPTTWAQVIKFMLFAQLFQDSVGQLASQLLQWRLTRESGRRMAEYLERPCVFDEAAPGEALPGEPVPVALDGVSVAMGTGRSILRDVSLGVAAGQHVALCGPSGCGKTTLLQALVRGVEPSAGRCLLGSTPLERYGLHSLAGGVGFVPQTPVLLNTSIRQNLLLALRRPTGRALHDDQGPLDLARLGHVRSAEDLDRELAAIARAVGLETDLIGKCLDGPLPQAPASEAFRSRIQALRQRVAEALNACPPQAVVHLDPPEGISGYVDAWTLRENLLLGRPDASLHGVPERVERLVLAALSEEGLADAAVLLGLEFQVGEGGRFLSGGQRQKVAIARAILKNPSLLLLDEATASLDEASQARIMEMIKSRLARQTVISITHRLSTVRGYDRVLVMDRGQVVQDGTYAELAGQDGVFRGLLRQEQGEPTADTCPPAAAAGSEDMRVELQRKAAMSGVFRHLRSGQLGFLSQEMRIARCQRGDVLFRRGDPGRDLYLILDGEVEFFIERGQGDGKAPSPAEAGFGAHEARVLTVVNTAGPGGVFGELAMFGEGRRSVGARAATDATLGVLGREALVSLIHADPAIAVELLGTVSAHLSRTADRAYDVPEPAPEVA